MWTGRTGMAGPLAAAAAAVGAAVLFFASSAVAFGGPADSLVREIRSDFRMGIFPRQGEALAPFFTGSLGGARPGAVWILPVVSDEAFCLPDRDSVALVANVCGWSRRFSTLATLNGRLTSRVRHL